MQQYIQAVLNYNIPLVEFMYLVFTRKPGENYSRRLRSLLFTSVTYFEHYLTLLCVDQREREYGIRNTEILFNKAIAPFEGV